MLLGIPVKSEKTPFSNQYTARGTAFRLYFTSGWFRPIDAYESFLMRLSGTHSHGRSPVRLNRLATPVGEEKSTLPSLTWWPSLPGMRDRGCMSWYDFYWPSLLFYSLCPSSSLVFITSVTNDLPLLSVQPGGELLDHTVDPSPGPCHLVCDFR